MVGFLSAEAGEALNLFDSWTMSTFPQSGTAGDESFLGMIILYGGIRDGRGCQNISEIGQFSVTNQREFFNTLPISSQFWIMFQFCLTIFFTSGLAGLYCELERDFSLVGLARARPHF